MLCRINVTACSQAQLGDDSVGGYKSPPPCLIDLTSPLDQEQDDAEIVIFKVFQRVGAFRADALMLQHRPC